MSKPTRQQAIVLAKRARHYLANSRKLIAHEPEAAEKSGEILWGAVVLAIKAVAAAQGKTVSKYQHVRAFLGNLVGERSATMQQFRSFWAFHGRFYEGEVRVDDVLASQDVAEEWIEALLAEENL